MAIAIHPCHANRDASAAPGRGPPDHTLRVTDRLAPPRALCPWGVDWEKGGAVGAPPLSQSTPRPDEPGGGGEGTVSNMGAPPGRWTARSYQGETGNDASGAREDAGAPRFVRHPNWSARVLAGCLGAASVKSTDPFRRKLQRRFSEWIDALGKWSKAPALLSSAPAQVHARIKVETTRRESCSTLSERRPAAARAHTVVVSLAGMRAEVADFGRKPRPFLGFGVTSALTVALPRGAVRSYGRSIGTSTSAGA